MQVLLQIKSYDNYFQYFFEEDEKNDLEPILNHLKDNKECEIVFKRYFIKEKKFEKINKLLSQLWLLSKKINIINKYGHYPLKLILDLFESLEKEYEFNNDNFSRYINLYLYILIKSLKIESIYHNSLEKFEMLITKYNNKINITILRDLLVNEGFEEVANSINKCNYQDVKKLPLIEYEEIRTLAPTHLKFEMTKCLNYEDNNRLVTYIGNDYFFYTLIGNYGINSSIGIYYFEVEIIKICDDTIGIGLIGKDFNVQNKIPGWENNSIGYHSDDGNIFISKTTGEAYGPTFKDNDIIGCCVDYTQNNIFFTKNGIALKNVHFEPEGEIYTAIAMRKKDQSIRINLGEREFLYDIDNYTKNVYDKLIKDIYETNSSMDSADKDLQIITDYLINMGYENTFSELYKYKNWYSDQNIKVRKMLKDLIISRKFVEAKKLTLEVFPNSQKSILFLEYLISINDLHTLINNKINIVESLFYVRKNIVSHDEFMNSITIKIVECISLNDIEILWKTINDILDSEENFLYINRNILEKEYSTKNNELDVIFKQIALVLKENIKLKNPVICYLLNNKKFVERLINTKY